MLYTAFARPLVGPGPAARDLGGCLLTCTPVFIPSSRLTKQAGLGKQEEEFYTPI